MKYLAILFFAAAAAFGIGALASPGSGYGFAAGAAGVMGGLTVGVSKARTGKWFTDESGGH